MFSESVTNAELMQKLNLVPKLLFVLQDDSVTDSTAHTIASVLSVLLSNTSDRKNLLRFVVIAIIHRISKRARVCAFFFVVKLNCICLDFVLVLLPERMELRIKLVGMDISPIKLNSTFECTCIKLLRYSFFLAFFALFRTEVLIKKKVTP